MGTYSNLCNDIVDGLNRKSNPRGGNKITKITPHHMAGNIGAVQCAKMHMNSPYDQSASAYIGTDGQICGGVQEENRPWTSGSASNDYQAYTIEVANNTFDPNWTVSAAAYESLVRLCADVCRRYNINPHYDGTPNGTITMHKQFQATGCPGPYLEKIITSGQFERDIKAQMSGLLYRAHVQSIGWMPWVSNGQTAGTTGKSKRMEAVQFDAHTQITAQCHCQTYGDMDPVKAGDICGTTGQSKRLEAIKLDAPYEIAYRLHLQGTGWTDWVSNGTWCGTKGEARRAEAIEVKRV